VVGFHIQQAVEKALKAAVALAEVEIPRSHDISILVELLAEHGIEAPVSVSRAEWLSAWAVTNRYDEMNDVLDRTGGLQVASAAIQWAREFAARFGSTATE
jgi:HEPN domain-containing protein